MSPGVQKLRAADAALGSGDLDHAISLAQEALQADPRQAVAANVLGRAAAARFAKNHDANDAVLAQHAFEQAYAANPDFWPAEQNLGELYEKQGRVGEAAEAYRKVLAANPQHPDRKRFEALIARADAGS